MEMIKQNQWQDINNLTKNISDMKKKRTKLDNLELISFVFACTGVAIAIYSVISVIINIIH